MRPGIVMPCSSTAREAITNGRAMKATPAPSPRRIKTRSIYHKENSIAVDALLRRDLHASEFPIFQEHPRAPAQNHAECHEVEHRPRLLTGKHGIEVAARHEPDRRKPEQNR